ncbi:ribosome maturation factor RimM [Bdellovibrionota bacterium]
MATPFVPLGRIVRAHGLRGEVLVKPYSNPSPTLETLEVIYFPGPKPLEQKVISRRQTPHGYLLQFADVNTRDAAERLRGQEVVCRQEDLPELDESEVYSYQLIGLSVCTSDRELGTITEVVSTGGQDLMVVQGNGREYLIPAVPEILVDIDLADGVVTIDPPQGMLELCGTTLSHSSQIVSQDP